jgi:hypothetical protein
MDNVVNATNFFLDHIITNAMVPGKVENWTTIFDFNGVGALSSKQLQLVARTMS